MQASKQPVLEQRIRGEGVIREGSWRALRRVGQKRIPSPITKAEVRACSPNQLFQDESGSCDTGEYCNLY